MISVNDFPASVHSHMPVLLAPILSFASPVGGNWLDGTFGAGGYTRGLLEAGAKTVTALDRDPSVFKLAAELKQKYKKRLHLVEGVFSNLDQHGSNLNGVVLDLGVSSMQLDQAERGFSFLRDGPLDMRMGVGPKTAAELINFSSETDLANILFFYGEEHASRRIAKAIIKRRAKNVFESTLDLAQVIESVMPRQKPGRVHPATRSFQAIRVAVNNEYQELFNGLHAAERALSKGGLLIVVTFQSIEDRMVKRFLQVRSGLAAKANRFAPEIEKEEPQFELVTKKAIGADTDEISLNPRARSAKLRIARRTGTASVEMLSHKALGMPIVKVKQ